MIYFKVNGSISGLDFADILDRAAARVTPSSAKFISISIHLIFVVIFFLMLSFDRDPSVDVPAGTFLVLFAAWAFFAQVPSHSVQRRVEKSYQNSNLRYGDITVEARDIGIKLSGPHFTTELKWSCLVDAEVTQNFILVYVGDIECIPLPRSLFETDEAYQLAFQNNQSNIRQTNR